MATLVNGFTGAIGQPKPIRFVHNQGQPPQKRRRINAACLTCRKRKTRCAGEHPTCSTCTKNGHECAGYADVVEKKKGHDGSHVDADDEDYFDEEQHEERRHWKTGRNENRQHDAAGGIASSRRMSESGPYTAIPSVRPKIENIEWDDQQPQSKLVRRPTNHRNQSMSTDASRSPSIRSSVQLHTETRRVPYFRYFGPTAIVPGYKQMVVKVPGKRRSSMSTTSPGSGFLSAAQTDHELGQCEDMPVYDPNDSSPVHGIIMNLIKTFFDHLGCNFPFLRQEKFTTLVEEKQVESILVDSVCALAARFSELSVFKKLDDGKLSPPDYGQVFAQRAKSATVDTFPCPSVAAVQACLLMAYEGFGADQDSTLWMYLGMAIRMAVDLGLHKKDGVKYQGDKEPWSSRSCNQESSSTGPNEVKSDEEDVLSVQEQQELEQERIDTFWSVFMLDRVISSGTGRPVTLRDDEFDLELPQPSIDYTGLPDPFPDLIQIINVYGRASDILNKIKIAKDLTQDRIRRLLEIERELTKLVQRQAPQLQFTPQNFKLYAENGRGTTFILLHFWFHALMTVLHQPTLLDPLGKINSVGELAELLPNSREISMNSAKTIGDILAFAMLISPRTFVGNPFTSQPIYIAACAFLAASVAHSSQPVSRDTTPVVEGRFDSTAHGSKNWTSDSKGSTRHPLLVSAATQNYQSCYKALKHMHTHWGGIRYIITALDQRSQGISDCETYTREEYASARIAQRNDSIARILRQQVPASPIPPLAWSLTGTTNSPNSTQLAILWQQGVPGAPAPSVSASTPPGNMIYDPIRQSLPDTAPMYPPAYPQPNTSALHHSQKPPQTRRVSNTPTQSRSAPRFDGLSSDDAGRGSSTPESNFISLASQSGHANMTATSYTPTPQHSSGYEPSNHLAGASPSSTVTDGHLSSTHSQHQSNAGSRFHSSTTPGGGTYSSDGGLSNFAQSGSGLGGCSYLGNTSQGYTLYQTTFENQSEFGQQLSSFEPGDMMQWFGDFMPFAGLYDTTGSSIWPTSQ